MFPKVIAILLLSTAYLGTAENSTAPEALQSSTAPTSIGNTTTRETETTKSASYFVTEQLLLISNTSQQQPDIITQNQSDQEVNLKPRGKTKFLLQNTIQQASNEKEVQRNETPIQTQGGYLKDKEAEALQEQQQELLIATAEKEEFIQSELHSLAKDIAETEQNYEDGKPNSSPRPSTWKSFFSNIFPQGILNVFHLSVTAEPQKKVQSTVVMNRLIDPTNATYQRKRMIYQLSTLPITLPMAITPPIPIPTISPISPILPTQESTSISSATLVTEDIKNGTLMTNKDVYDINSAAEVSEVPFETVIPMESINIFRIHPLNCEENCDEESEDYIDEQLSESGDDNVVAFSRESPQNIFYPTPKPLPYGEQELNKIPSAEVFYPMAETQTSEEIIRENLKDFGKKIPYHPVKQLDDFQKEVEKQFDHNEVRIDAEAASRKFLKHFKGKYVKPQDSTDAIQSSTFKGINHFELVASTLRPEVNFMSQPSPVKPEAQLHTYIYSAGFKPDSMNMNMNMNMNMEPEGNGKGAQGQNMGGEPTNSQNMLPPYSNTIKPESLLHTYIFSAQDNNNNSMSSPMPEAPKSQTSVPSWTMGAKENTVNIPNQLKPDKSSSSSYDIFPPFYTFPTENPSNDKNANQNIAPTYSGNLKPESLLHTYIYSAFDKGNNSSPNALSMEPPKAPEMMISWVPNKPAADSSQSLSSFDSAEKTYLCSADQVKAGTCPYSPPNAFFEPKDIIEIQKSFEQQVKHSKPYLYYNYPNYPAVPPMLSKNPIRVAQPENPQPSQSQAAPAEGYQQRQKLLQDQQNQLNQQQEFFQQQQLQQYQQKLQYQQQQKYLQDQQKHQQQLQQYQQMQQQQLQQYQQKQQQQYEQQNQQYKLQKEQQEKQQAQLQQFLQVQQQQRLQQELLKQQKQLQLYQQEQQKQLEQQQLQQQQQKEYEQQQQEQQMQIQQLQNEYQRQQKDTQMQLQMKKQQQQKQNQQMEQQQPQQEKQPQPPQQEQQPEKLIRYNTVKVEKVVQKPYPVAVKEVVEKIVERPVHVERIVEKPVNVPYPVREIVEKIVDRPYPVEKIIDRPVHVPYPVQVDHFIDRPYAVRVPVPVAVPVPVHQYIDRPYPVEKIVEKPIHVPYPVDKIVEKVIEKHIPIEVERIVEKPVPAKKLKLKKSAPLDAIGQFATPALATVAPAQKNKSKINAEELLELVPPPVDQTDHDNYKTLPDDVEFILLDDYNGPVPLDNQSYAWNKPEKRGTKNNIKRSPEFRRNLRVEYGFRPPLIPSVEIGEKGLI